MVIANCTSADWNWTSNSKGQSPCTLASALGKVCNDAGFDVPPIGLNGYYLTPLKGYDNPCVCSSVFYSLLCACAKCQGGQYLRWSYYSTNCSTNYLATFPRALPQGFPVPLWAYQNVSVLDMWYLALGPQDVNTNAEVTPVAVAGNSTTLNPPQNGTGGVSAESSVKKGDTGAIVGGAVGGILGLALIGASVYVFLSLRHRKRHEAAPEGYDGKQAAGPQIPGKGQSQGAVL